MRASPDPLGFAFTEHDTPELRSTIEGHLRLIVDTVQKADPALVALILTGGFSRGEGTARGGRPLNDYDLVAVRSRPGGGARYQTLHQGLSRAIGIEVDLVPVWRARLSSVGRKLFWLDLRNGGRVIHGPSGVVNEVRRIEARALSPMEAPRLLANRAAGLLLAVPGPAQAVDAAQVDLQATKAVLAAMDASLLAKGQYAARLRERLELARGHPDGDIFARAVEWKLGGFAPILGAPWWRTARDVLLRAVEETGAERVRDGLAERLVHLARARRPAWQPSRRVREEAWALLRDCEFPDGTPGWGVVRQRFFEKRALTLQ